MSDRHGGNGVTRWVFRWMRDRMPVSRHHDPIEPLRRPAMLDEYSGKWVAVLDGDVVASAATTSQLAIQLRRLRVRGARTQFVPPPSKATRVGVG